MLKVYACLTEQHDVRFVFLAAAICLLSSLTAFALARQTQELWSMQRLRWVLLLGYVTGVGIWATHFVAMLAYEPNLPTAYAPIATTVSVIVPIAFSMVGWLLNFSPRKHARVLASLTITAGIGAMHFVGMSALRTTGTIRYDLYVVGLSVVTAGALVGFALGWRRGRLPRVPLMSGLALALGICALHFGSMAAVAIVPDGSVTIPVQAISRNILTAGVVVATLVLLMIAVFVIILDIRVRRTKAEVSHTMTHDPLTGLLNIAGFDTAAVELLGQAAGRRFAFVRIDLDQFASVNKTYGRTVGDRVMVEVGARLKACCGDALVGRFMGDDFSILVAEQASSSVDALARAIADRLAEPISAGAELIRLGVHIGISQYPDHSNHLQGLRRMAGFALYRAKMAQGPPCLAYAPAMEQQTVERHELEILLGEALAGEQFSLRYQPIACVTTGGIVGFEALLRWRHPVRGDVSPAEFVPVAEAAGLMNDIGNWVLTESCSQAAQWSQPLKVAVNLSVVQFSDSDLVAKVKSALAASGLAPWRLELEITESMLIEDTDKTVEILREIKAMGVRIAMDDFGTGFSSLSYFRLFPFDKVKIDQSFVKDMVHNRQSMAIVTAVIGLSRVLGMVVLAEGVETAEQLEVLSAEGCHQVQGYLIGKPAAAEELAELTGQIDAPSHYCGTRCDECLERLRPPCPLKTAAAPKVFITRSDRPDIAA